MEYKVGDLVFSMKSFRILKVVYFNSNHRPVVGLSRNRVCDYIGETCEQNYPLIRKNNLINILFGIDI